MVERSLLINTYVLEELNISCLEFLYLYFLYSEKNLGIPFNDIDEKKLQEKKLIKLITNEKTILRQKSIDLIEFSLVEANVSFNEKKKEVKKPSRAKLKELDEFVDVFRNKWQGLKPGAMGGKNACKVKLRKWMLENPEYSFEEILAAADLYLTTEGRDTKFLQRADYFIYKNDINRNEASRLSAYIDDVVIGETGDWTSKLN